MNINEGWLLQSYPAEDGGLTLWFIDIEGERHTFSLDMQVCFYAAGPFHRLRQLWKRLRSEPTCIALARETHTDLHTGPIEVMAITADIAHQPALFQIAINAFPDLDYYNADILPSLHLVAQHGIFPLAYCQIQTLEQEIVNIELLDDPWKIAYDLPPLRLLFIEPECDPFHKTPSFITIKTDRTYTIHVEPESAFFIRVRAIINRFDPDMIVTAYGDKWLFPKLFAYCEEKNLAFNPCRDQDRQPLIKAPLSYQAYGQIVFRESQTYLFGRLHIDAKNLTQIYESGLIGIFEQSRITGMPLQEGSRRSPGAGFSAMQTITAVREQVLVPFRKAQAEKPKSALALIRADQGGLIGQPTLGVHYGAIEFDFISMYPAIIVLFNLSPETLFKEESKPAVVPQLGYAVDTSTRGLIPKTLTPLVDKRIRLKTLLRDMNKNDSRYLTLKQQNNAQKSLQTVAFGYMGHKHFRYTQIEVHESITAYSREAMLQTKQILEDAGYQVVHLYVDGIYFKRAQPSTSHELNALIAKIEKATGLPIGNEGVYKWIIFLPSREDPNASVPNRYFGVFANGEIKIRGIEARTRDTPTYIKEAQMAAIEVMAAVPFGQTLESCLPEAIATFREYVHRLQDDKVEPESLVITQVLTREIEEYKANTPAVRAAIQLAEAGKTVSKGMKIRYVLARGGTGVLAWDAEFSITSKMLDKELYLDRLISAGYTIFQSFGIEETALRNYLLYATFQHPLPFKAYSTCDDLLPVAPYEPSPLPWVKESSIVQRKPRPATQLHH